MKKGKCFWATVIRLTNDAGADRMCDAVEDMTGQRPWLLFKLCWRYFTPLICIVSHCSKCTLEAAPTRCLFHSGRPLFFFKLLNSAAKYGTKPILWLGIMLKIMKGVKNVPSLRQIPSWSWNTNGISKRTASTQRLSPNLDAWKYEIWSCDRP